MSTSNVFIVEVPPPPTYGFIEVQVWIRRHTWRALIYTIATVALLLLLYWAYSISKPAVEFTEAKLFNKGITLDPLQNPEKVKEVEFAPPPPDITQIIGKKLAVAGNPIPIPEATIDNYASIEDVATAAPHEGTIDPTTLTEEQLQKLLDDKGLKVNNPIIDIPPEDKFIPVEKFPEFDLTELQKSVEYPEMAIRANIEGQVVIRVYIDKEGMPKKWFVQSSDSQMLNDAATKAVLKTVFIPAMQNKQAIGCWINIPIRFQLKN